MIQFLIAIVIFELTIAILVYIISEYEISKLKTTIKQKEEFIATWLLVGEESPESFLNYYRTRRDYDIPA